MTARLLLALLGAALLVPFAAPAPADAASYWIWSCRGPDGAPVASDAWVPYGSAATTSASRADTCATGGALTLQLTPSTGDQASNAVTGFRLQLPPGTPALAYRIELAGRTSSAMSPPGRYDLGLAPGAEGSDLGIAPGAGCAVIAAACAFGDLDVPLAPANAVSGTMTALTVLRFKALCRAGGGCTPGPATPPVLGRLFRAAIEIDDPDPPVVGALSGSATATGPIGGSRSVAAPVSDAGGGIHRTELLVDGVAHATRNGTGRCAEPFTAPVPCPDAERAAFDLDTTALADGAHTVVIRATDAAGATTESAPLAITVDNRPPALPAIATPPTALPPAPVATLAGARLVLPARRSAITGARVTGRLLGPDGLPRVGVPVRFERRPFGGDSRDWNRQGAATTRADGRFTLPRVREAGEVRALVGDADQPAASATVAFVAPARVTARASDRTLRNGDRLTLHATVRGDGDAFTGRDALVQARVSGRWRTVASVRVAGGGRVRWVYRFTSTRTTARYRFRVVLPQARRLPWRQLRSPVVTVLVRP